MTYKEKMMEIHPDAVDERYRGGVRLCPKNWGVGPEHCGLFYCNNNCDECWNKEYKGEQTEMKGLANCTACDKKIEKKTATKTKAELLDEIKELKKELERVERYKAYEEGANELKIAHDAFINAGFTNEQAFEIIMTTVRKAL